VYINGILVDVTYEKVDSILLYEDDSEDVYGDLYISNHSSVENLSNAIYYSDVNDFNYVLGGSFYNSHETASNYSYILVKLVPGLVDFNSSRDKIQDNERLDSLNKMVINQIQNNESILRKIYEKTNAKPLSSFLRNLYNLGAWKEESEFSLSKSMNFNNFVHNETGISFSELSEISKKAEAFVFECFDRRYNRIATRENSSKPNESVSLSKVGEYINSNFKTKQLSFFFEIILSSPRTL